MAVDNLEERLAAQQDQYANTPAASGGGQDELPEDGTYQALVRAWDFFEAKATGIAFVKLELEIQLDEEYSGRGVDKIWQLEPREDQDADQWRKMLSRLKGDLKTIGIPADTPLTEIRPGSDALTATLDVPLEIAIKTSDRTNDKGEPYRNVYINERLGGPLQGGQAHADVPADTSDFGAPPLTDDDIPF